MPLQSLPERKNLRVVEDQSLVMNVGTSSEVIHEQKQLIEERFGCKLKHFYTLAHVEQ